MSHEPIVPSEVLIDVTADIEDLIDSMKNKPLSYQVEVGSVLWLLGDMAAKAMDSIKANLRDAALAENPEEGATQTFQGDGEGVATVKIPHSSIKLPKGADTESLKKALGEDYKLFFEEVCTSQVRKDFESRIAMSEETQKAKLVQLVERVENTPRVSFRRIK